MFLSGRDIAAIEQLGLDSSGKQAENDSPIRKAVEETVPCG
jgi:hypothetical protein